MSDRSDNFNRADSTTTLGTPSDGGSAWVAHAGTWGISSNEGYKVATGAVYEIATLEASSAVVDVQATYASVGGNTWGLNARAADNSNFILYLVTAATIYIYKRVAGTFTELGNTTFTAVDGSVFKGTCSSGNVLKMFADGVEKLSATDSAGSGNTKHGLVVYDLGSRFDTFSITDQAGAASYVRPTIIVSPRAPVQRAANW